MAGRSREVGLALLVLAGLVGIAGCAPGINGQVVGAMGLAPAPQQTAAPPANASELALNIVVRSQALRRMAWDAVQFDGTPQAEAVRRATHFCQGDRQSCMAASKAAEAQSKVGALAGLADYLTQPLTRYPYGTPPGGPMWLQVPPDFRPILQAEPDVALAESLAKQAMDVAHATADARAEQQRKANSEVSDATTTCAADEKACKERCDKGEPAFCLVWGAHLRDSKPPRLAEARDYVKKACDSGMGQACTLFADLNRTIQAAETKLNDLWYPIQEAADKIVSTNDGAARALGLVGSVQHPAQVQAAVGRMRRFVVAVVTEAYCPARGEFVRAASEAEFAKRASQHCASEAPQHEGVALTAQCKAVFATPCPAPPPRRVPPVADEVNGSPAWQAVQGVGDHMAAGRFLVVAAVRQEPSAQNVRNTQILPQIEARQITSDYCPAKKAFLSQFTVAQFKKAVADHCGGDPPTARGVSGADVPLPAECTAVFATPCP